MVSWRNAASASAVRSAAPTHDPSSTNSQPDTAVRDPSGAFVHVWRKSGSIANSSGAHAWVWSTGVCPPGHACTSPGNVVAVSPSKQRYAGPRRNASDAGMLSVSGAYSPPP
ncbi:Uncharacterised protein [Mycobacteroides abscessus]|nr:Uncharacterised protein [Mycobacteroides abscessus]